MSYLCCRGSESQKTKRFRQLYNDIAQLRSLWSLNRPIPVVALTATATQQTVKYIIKNLELKPPIRIINSPHRSNFRYTVINVIADKPSEVLSSLIDELKSKGREMRRVLVFCQRLNHVRSLYRSIDSQMESFKQKEGSSLQLYEKYQGNTDEHKKELITTSLATTNGDVRLLIATVAFGMGVDCKDLDLIVHYGPPSDIDNYCQETGRAGRDGQQSHAVLILFPKAVSKRTSPQMKAYCKNKDICRRKVIFSNFEGTYDNINPLHNCCDICASKCKCDDVNKECLSRENRSFQSKFEQNLLASHLTKEGKQHGTSNLSRVILNDEGIAILSSKLLQYRNNLLENVGQQQIYTGYDIATGFPAKAIPEIISKIDVIKLPSDVMDRTCIFNDDHCEPIFHIIQTVLDDTDFPMIDINSGLESSNSNADPLSEHDTDHSSCENSSNDSESFAFQKRRYKVKPLLESSGSSYVEESS